MTTNELPREPNELDRLVAAAQDGDRPAFDELVRRTYVDTYTLALASPADEEDARDVVQEAYLRAWKGLDALPRRRAVHHVAVPHHRQLRLHHRSSAGAGTAHDEPLDDARRADRRPARAAARGVGRDQPPTCARLAGALDDLPPKLRARRGAPGRLRPAARGDRRRARDLGVGGQGPAPPGAASAARRCSTTSEPRTRRRDRAV